MGSPIKDRLRTRDLVGDSWDSLGDVILRWGLRLGDLRCLTGLEALFSCLIRLPYNSNYCLVTRSSFGHIPFIDIRAYKGSEI